MQRELLFRAKYQQSEDVNDLKWVYGYLCMAPIPHKPPMISIQTGTETDNTPWNGARHVIHHPETIGQFTGCNDIKGNKIFEGDILRDEEGNTGFVVFKDGSFEIKQTTGIQLNWCNSFYDPYGRLFTWDDLEIIGNIHDKKD